MKNTITTEHHFEQPSWVTTFIEVYNSLSIENLSKLKHLYHQDVQFIDPLKQVHGLIELKAYFEHMYENTTACKFTLESCHVSDSQTALYWHMTVSHRRLNQGKSFTVNGHSQIQHQEGLIIYHRDYFDLGAMIYENIPIMGALIQMIKRRAN